MISISLAKYAPINPVPFPGGFSTGVGVMVGVGVRVGMGVLLGVGVMVGVAVGGNPLAEG